MSIFKGFASDNNASVHPQVIEAMLQANQGHAIAYGDDPITRQAIALLKSIFGQHVEAYFVFIGTAANTLGLKAATQSFHSIICADTAHIQVDECGAPEKFTGCKLIPVPAIDGKITPELVKPHLHGFGFEHHSQPKVISITQTTEMGTVYTIEEIKDLADLAHRHNMYLHMDGARIANAAVALQADLAEFTRHAGVDILSLGGTKNGLMYGEAIIFLNPAVALNFKYFRKQAMQLASKMRFISAQFLAMFENDLWLKNAKHANEMAALLAQKLVDIPQIRITRPVQANAVFAQVPPQLIAPLQDAFFFYVWDEIVHEVRWMTSWDTEPHEVEAFVQTIRRILATQV